MNRASAMALRQGRTMKSSLRPVPKGETTSPHVGGISRRASRNMDHKPLFALPDSRPISMRLRQIGIGL
jgi:hypothetical protein